MLVPPASAARFQCPPCIFQKWKKQQQRKLNACARPPVPLAPPPPRPSPADAAVARQSRGAFQQRPPAASSRRLQGPPSPGTGALFLTQACAPRSGSSRLLPPPPETLLPGFPRSHAGLANLQQPQLIVSTGNNFISLNSTYESST
ncbi:Tigger Transposable Element-Derived Protein 1 [Manis pentadactyla]|nr:Tigger Transposable Element-Derived Protein 1 [Manis pentadactyla]